MSRHQKQSLFLLTAAALVLLFSSCGGDDELETPDVSDGIGDGSGSPTGPDSQPSGEDSDEFDCFDAMFSLLDVVGNSVDPAYVGGTCPTATRLVIDDAESVELDFSPECNWSGAIHLALTPNTLNQGDLDVSYTALDMDGTNVAGAMTGAYLIGEEKVTLELLVDQTLTGNLQCTITGPVTIVVDKRDVPPPPVEGNPVARITLAVAGAAAGGLLLFLYGMVFWRFACPRWAATKARPRVAYRAALDLLSEVGHQRRYGETREDFAARLENDFPIFTKITDMHMAARFDWPTKDLENRREYSAVEWSTVLKQLRKEIGKKVQKRRRFIGRINPISFFSSR